MTIRPAVLTDRDAILGMALRFMRESHYGTVITTVSVPGVTALIDSVLGLASDPDHGAALAIVAEDDGGVFGMLGLVACPHPLSGEPYGDELCWWVDPVHRGALLAGPRLLQRAEAWARARGLKFLKMVAPIDQPVVGRFYQHAGYAPVEMAYVKGLA